MAQELDVIHPEAGVGFVHIPPTIVCGAVQDVHDGGLFAPFVQDEISVVALTSFDQLEQPPVLHALT